MDDKEIYSLQAVLTYYRNKCSELEFQFVHYKTKAEQTVQALQEQIKILREHLEEASLSKGKERKSDGKTDKKK
jgi:hypothetical protein